MNDYLDHPTNSPNDQHAGQAASQESGTLLRTVEQQYEDLTQSLWTLQGDVHRLGSAVAQLASARPQVRTLPEWAFLTELDSVLALLTQVEHLVQGPLAEVSPALEGCLLPRAPQEPAALSTGPPRGAAGATSSQNN